MMNLTDLQPQPRLLNEFGVLLEPRVAPKAELQQAHSKKPNFEVTLGNVAFNLTVPLTCGSLGFLVTGQPENAAITGAVTYVSFLVGAAGVYRHHQAR